MKVVNVRFNEKLVFGNKYKKNNIKYWETVFEEINKEKWFIEFHEDLKENSNEIQETEGLVKRKR